MQKAARMKALGWQVSERERGNKWFMNKTKWRQYKVRMVGKYINDASMIDTVDSEAENSALENLQYCGTVRGDVLVAAEW